MKQRLLVMGLTIKIRRNTELFKQTKLYGAHTVIAAQAEKVDACRQGAHVNRFPVSAGCNVFRQYILNFFSQSVI